jgi:hypothetical protein
MSKSVCHHCGFVVDEAEYFVGLDLMARHYVAMHGSFTYSDGSMRFPAPTVEVTSTDEFIYATV